MVISNYSSAITDDSEIDSQTNQCPEIIDITVNTAGLYAFTSLSYIDSYACLYQDYFNSSNLSSNQIICDDDSGGNYQFKFSVNLQSGIPYILVFATVGPGETGEFTIVGTGPDQIDFSPTDSVRPTMPTTTTSK
jgi:hypothetical protein